MSTATTSRRRIPAGLLTRNPAAMSYVVLAITWALSIAFASGFTSAASNQTLVRSASYLGIIAVGQTLVVMMGGIDLSVSGVVALSAVICAQVDADSGAVVAIIVALAASALVGMVNAAGIVYLRMPPIVMTLASGTILSGVLLIYTNGQPKSATIGLLSSLANDTVAGIPLAVFAWLVTTVAAWWLLHRSRYGRYGFALGSKLSASLASGVPVAGTTFIMYATCSALAGLSGLILLGDTGTSSLTMGSPYQLLSIAAVVLGGTSILGGRGHVAGTVSGALLLTLIQSLLASWNLTGAQRNVAEAFLIVALLLFYARERRDR